jgi:adenylate cyclase
MKAFLSPLARIFASRRSLGLAVLAALIAVRMSDPLPLEELRLRTFDLFQTIAPRANGPRPVVIVDIDEASLSAYGQWPWPRTLVADLLARLFEWKSTAVAFDVIFPEPDRTSPQEAMKYFSNIDEATRDRLLKLPSNDDVLAKAIGNGRVVLGQSGTRSINTFASEVLPETGIATLGPDPGPYLIAFPNLLRNLPQLERASAGRGLFTIATERDGMVRRVPLVMKAEGKVVAALSVDLLRVASGAGGVLVRSDQSGVRSVVVSNFEMPTDQNARVWIHFSPHDMTRYVSAKDVINGKASPEQFAGKLVLIGTSAIGLLDLKTTPVHSAMPGVEVHAQLLEAALSKSLLNAPASAMTFELLAAAVASLTLIVLAPMVSAIALFLMAALAGITILGGSWTLYSGYQTLIDPTFPLIAMLSVYTSVALVGYFREQSDRRRIRSAFSQYLSPSIVEQLANSPQKLVLGGEERNMTVLFSDVRGFTAISETFADDPQGLTALMNRFLTPLTNVIINRNGTIDKYMGDAIMAFWNAPLDDQIHELDACHAALDMIERVDSLNRERERESSEAGAPFVPIKIGIGINTGHCVVGNMGSELRFQYTAMGDAVNLASRLEGQTALHGVPILIGSRTAEAVFAQLALLEVDLIRVKGKTGPEVIYAVVGRTDVAESSDFKSLADTWAKMLVCYRKQDWSGVTEKLEQCRPAIEKFALGELRNLYKDRTDRFTKTPPPADWDGVFTAETK